MTEINAPAQADLERGIITRTVRIAAPRRIVWEALVTPAHVLDWWGHPMRFPDGIRPGSVGKFEWEGGEFDVRIDAMDEPATYTLTWDFGEDLDESEVTHVVFELIEDGDGTLVTVTESGFDRKTDLATKRARMEENTGGWNTVLDGLREFAETRAA
jgi:uncharacterized protein YndB with AHSA1/START domain